MTDSLALAQQLVAQHLAPIPIIGGTKKAAVQWTQFHNLAPRAKQLPFLFGQDDLTVGVICGAASDRLLVLDCDNPAALARMRDQLHDPETWIVKTARGGHIYLRTPTTVATSRLDGVDLKAHRSYVLAPGAKHPSGITYEFIRQTERIMELDSFDALAFLNLRPVERQFDPPDGMPALAWHILRNHAPLTDYENDRSLAESTAVTSLAHAGYSFDRTVTAFRRHAHGKSKFVEMYRADAANAERWLHLLYDNAAAFIQADDKHVLSTIRELRGWAETAVWAGRSGAWDRAVYLAHLTLAERAVKLQYGASVREIAEGAGVEIITASRASKRLIRQNLIEIAIPSIFTFSTVWNLAAHSPLEQVRPSEQAFISKRYNPSFPNVRECNFMKRSENFAEHDAFSGRGLGKSAAQIWHILTALAAGEALSTSEIAAQSGRGKVTVWRVLQRMNQLQMVESSGSGNATIWRALANVNLDQIAFLLGVAGRGMERKKNHRRERDAFRSVMTERAEDNNVPR